MGIVLSISADGISALGQTGRESQVVPPLQERISVQVNCSELPGHGASLYTGTAAPCARVNALMVSRLRDRRVVVWVRFFMGGWFPV